MGKVIATRRIKVAERDGLFYGVLDEGGNYTAYGMTTIQYAKETSERTKDPQDMTWAGDRSGRALLATTRLVHVDITYTLDTHD